MKHMDLPESSIRISESGIPVFKGNRYLVYARADSNGYIGGFYLSSSGPRRQGAKAIAQKLNGVVMSEDEGGYLILLDRHPPVDPLRELLGFETIGKIKRRSRGKLYRPLTKAAA